MGLDLAMFPPMRKLFILMSYLFVTLDILLRPMGARSITAEPLLLKHQRIVLSRPCKRALNLTGRVRLFMEFLVGLIRPKRLYKIATALKHQTLLQFHHALIRLKYHLFYAPRRHVRPAPKSSSMKVINAIVALMQCISKMGCLKITDSEDSWSPANGNLELHDLSSSALYVPRRAAPLSLARL